MNNLLTFINSFNAGIIFALPTVILFLFAAYFAGFILIAKIFKIELKNKAVASIIALVSGVDLFSLLILLLGTYGLISSFLVWTILLTAGSGGIALAVKELKGFKKIKPELFIALPIILFGILTLGAAISYPIGWDELVYHAAVPFRWLNDGNPLVYKDNPFSGFPSSPEFIFWFLISAAGIKAIRLFMWCMNLTLVCAFFLLLKDKDSLPGMKKAALLTALIFSPIFIMLCREAYVEVIILLNMIAAILFLKSLRSDFNLYKSAIITALFAASCLNVKLTGIFTLIVIFIMSAPKFIPFLKFSKFTVLFGISAVLFAFPFYLRPLLATGNPFYPYFANIFSTEKASFCMSLYHHDAGTLKFGVKSIFSFITTPILLSFDLTTYDGSFGCQFLIMLIIALIAVLKMFSGRTFHGTGRLIFSLLVLYVFWFFSAQQARFLVPFLLLFIYFISQCTHKNPLLTSRLIPVLILACTVISIPLPALKHSFNSWKMSLQSGKLLDYIYSGTGNDYLPSAAVLCNLNGPPPKTMLLFDNRTLYIPHKSEIGTPFFQEKYFTGLIIEGKFDRSSMKKEITDGGFTHIMLNLTNRDPDRINKYLELSKPFIAMLNVLEKEGFLKRIHEADTAVIYQVVSQK